MTASFPLKTALIAGAVTGLCVFFAPVVLAAGGLDPDGEVRDLMYRILNFGVLLIILIFAARKFKLKDFFTSRSEGIKSRLATLQQQKEEAEKRCGELEAALAGFQSERDEIIRKFRAEGEAERDRIIADATEKAHQILAQADMTIRRELKNTEDRLRSELAGSVEAMARELIAETMTDKDQEFLVDEFIKRVERLH